MSKKDIASMIRNDILDVIAAIIIDDADDSMIESLEEVLSVLSTIVIDI